MNSCAVCNNVLISASEAGPKSWASALQHKFLFPGFGGKRLDKDS
jgi:hypothetical protein